ncbi:MAG: CoA pyrophosphatase [Proteobacteria bacterium]|nr:CoA pyrophosphatase [Pseudomonadota bacterium]
MRCDPDRLRRILKDRKRISSRPRGFRRAAVLVPIFERQGDSGLIFTRRTETVSTHKGEISFPGGAVDPGDRGSKQAALRESEEELSLPSRQVEVVGFLDDIVTLSLFRITPVVGFVREPCSLYPNPQEIEKVFEIPVTRFLDPVIFRTEEKFEFQGRPYPIYYFHLPEVTIWGATAKILKQFLTVCCSWDPGRP